MRLYTNVGEGLSAIGRQISLMENHDQAFYIWRDAGVKDRLLVHIDAHHDMWWMGEKSSITIANFICPALKEGLVREIIWVTPDGTFENAKSRRPVLRHLARILKEYPGSSRSPLIEESRITASVAGKKLTICPLESLPPPKENVLLDIDLDYLLIPRVSYGENDRHSALPWRWPDELASRLRGFQSDMVTIVYSVEGGYTPLAWKHLGHEILLRLKDGAAGSPTLEGMVRMREAAEAENRGDSGQAESKYRLAMEMLPRSAAPRYRLARLLLNRGRTEEARCFYRQAVELDPSYKGAYSSAGFHFYWRQEFEAANREFRDMEALDPEDKYVRLGLGLLAKKRKRWDEAERRLRSALSSDECLLDAWHALGGVLAKGGRRQDAILAYERALKLGLKGHKRVSGFILTHAREHEIQDPLHCDLHARLAALYAQDGATARAVNALRIAIRGGFDGATIRLRLARLYARQRQWRKSATEIWQAAKVAPNDVRRGQMRLRRWLRANSGKRNGGIAG